MTKTTTYEQRTSGEVFWVNSYLVNASQAERWPIQVSLSCLKTRASIWTRGNFTGQWRDYIMPSPALREIFPWQQEKQH